MKRKIIAISSLLLFTSCADSNPQSAVIKRANDTEYYQKAVDTMLNSPFRVTFTGSKTKEYPEGYTGSDAYEEYQLSREYGYMDSRGAIRLITPNSTTTYLEDENGYAIEECLNAQNQVEIYYPGVYGRKTIFQSNYANPFESLSGDDFTSDGQLNAAKTYYLFSNFTNLSHSIKSSTASFDEDGRIEKIAIEFNRTPFGILTSDGSILDGYSSMEGELTFSYDVANFSHLEKADNENLELDDALKELSNNYTLYIDSDSYSRPIVIYATDSLIYIHTDAYCSYPLEGDLAFKKRNSGLYRTYEYTTSFTVSDRGDVELNSILPTYSTYSSTLFTELSSNRYQLISEALNVAADELFLPELGITDGVLKKTEISLNDSSLDTITGILYSGGNYTTVKMSFSGINSTSLPLWLDADSINA